jgi:hypothetical protein
MIKTRIGENLDGSPRFNYELTQEEHDQGMVAMLTGPISGTLSVPDGSAYDVTEFAIPVHRDHVEHLLVEIHRAHHRAGRFLDVPVLGDKAAARPRAKRAANPKR